MPQVKIVDGKLVIGEGLDAIAIEGNNLNIKSLVNKIAGHYPDNYPWEGYPEDGFDEAIKYNFNDARFPPNNIPVSKIPACIRALKAQNAAMMSLLNTIQAQLIDLDAKAVKAEK